KKLGRPRALNDEQREEVLSYLKNGQSISSLAKIFNTTRQTIMRIRDEEFATAKSGVPA
ncbi:helix-turn-helix domain-containing protein, partial [Arsenophonus sp.]|uniref:helix-turn-helix domain-containing protein n=1 Tax=Arsenophonus sp. TaxID=1872640 RepID=UPI003879F070